MPERWERELRKLRDVELHEPEVRERIVRGPNADRTLPSRDRLVAGIVAAAIAVAAVAFLWQVIPEDEPRDIGGPAYVLPTLLVTFESNGTIDDGSSPDGQTRRVDTTIAYGDAREKNFTSTIPSSAIVHWVGIDDVTRFVPGPTAESQVQIAADGENARVLFGLPSDWPDFERFTPIETLPDQPGDYVLLFEADYPEGVARTARLVHVVSPGVLQLDIAEGKALDAADASAYVDGRRTEGFLSSSWFTESDVGGQSQPRAPTFEPDAWLQLPPGSPMLLSSVATEARAGLFASYTDFDLDARLPIDLLGSAGVIDGPDGEHLLAIDVTWRHVDPGTGQGGTEERALFFFPVEIVSSSFDEEVDGGSLVPSPSASSGSTATAADVLRIRCGPEGIEVLTPIVAAQADGLHIDPIGVPLGWSIAVTSSGEENVAMLSGSDGVDDLFVRPLSPGEARVMCGVRGILDSQVERFQDTGARFRLVDPAGYFTPYSPQCNDSDLLPFYRRMDGVDSEDAADRIRNEIPGVRVLDIVERAGYRVGYGDRYWWRIVRDEAVVAGLQVGPQGGGVIHGWVCGSSGIDPGGPP